MDQPVIAVLTAEDESLPPGLDGVADQARLLLANDRESLEQALTQADILLVTDFRTEMLAECWHLATRLRWIHATSAGVDALMFPELQSSSIPITNARGIFDRPIAEFVLGLVLAFAKDLPASVRYQDQHRWQHRDTETVNGKRALIIGAGSIGRQIGRLLAGVGMQVDAVARSARQDDPDFGRVHAQDTLLEELPGADFVVVAAPLTDDTRGLFSNQAFAAMNPDARFINIGRGPIVDTDALVAALRTGAIAGAGLDVFEEEPLPADHPLWAFPQAILSAHMAGDVVGWREALTKQFLANFRRWQAGEPLHNVVDKERGYVPPTK
ncbi:D-2-hydroxyacid dehydrogenase [Aquisalimonas sp.]|uniref:D-2-hydroxyacid dehydrogenase n=1 Tax=unclassified Aquisalimonas TaxID=2644645 RepID=UPI0025C47B03|nr:D-2-hydroxyacid dehydrogenase [Aquisalimonas sp.]